MDSFCNFCATSYCYIVTRVHVISDKTYAWDATRISSSSSPASSMSSSSSSSSVLSSLRGKVLAIPPSQVKHVRKIKTHKNSFMNKYQGENSQPCNILHDAWTPYKSNLQMQGIKVTMTDCLIMVYNVKTHPWIVSPPLLRFLMLTLRLLSTNLFLALAGKMHLRTLWCW